MRVLRLSPSR